MRIKNPSDLAILIEKYCDNDIEVISIDPINFTVKIYVDGDRRRVITTSYIMHNIDDIAPTRHKK